MLRLLSVKKIWAGPAGATVGYGGSLVRFGDGWYCNVRVRVPGQPSRVAGSGQEMILHSPDGDTWRTVASNAEKTLRGHDTFSRLSLTPDGRLAVLGTVAHGCPDEARTAISFSADGRTWSPPAEIGDPGFPFWRLNWNRREGAVYAFAQKIEPGRDGRWRRDRIRLYRSDDGLDFRVLVDEAAFAAACPPSPPYVASTFESAISFGPDGACCALLRRQRGGDGGWKDAPAEIASRENRENWREKSQAKWSEGHTGLLGVSSPPYTAWTWREVCRLAQPGLIGLPDGRVIAAGRAYEPKRVPLWLVDRERLALEELLVLPSAGFVGYPGFALHGGELWVAYHSAHETGRYKESNLYLARVRV